MKNGFLPWLLKKNIDDENVLDKCLGAVVCLVQKNGCIRAERGNCVLEELLGCQGYLWQQGMPMEKLLPTRSQEKLEKALERAAAGKDREIVASIPFKTFSDDLLNCRAHIFCLSASATEARYIVRLEYDKQLMIKEAVFEDALRQSRVNCWCWDMHTGMASFFNTDIFADYSGADFMRKDYFAVKNFPQDFVKRLDFVGNYSDGFMKFIRQLLHQKLRKDISTEIAFKMQDGRIVWAVFTARAVRKENGTLRYVMGTWQNITEKKLEERQQQQRGYLMKSFVKETLYGMTVDLDKNFFVADSSLESWMEEIRIFAAYYDQAIQEVADKCVAEEDRQKYLEFFHLERVRNLPENENFSMEYRRSYQGKMKWFKAMIVTFRLGEFSDKWMYMSIYDIDASKRKERKLEQLAATDALTGLFNRAHTLQAMAAYLENHPAGATAVVYMDLDNFKKVNDTLGHAAGDSLLMRVANAMRSYFGRQAILGRIGGDEFIMMYLDADKEYIAGMMSDFVNYAGEQCREQCPSINVTVSLGYVLSPDFGRDVTVLADLADKALYRAKQHGKNNAVQYAR